MNSDFDQKTSEGLYTFNQDEIFEALKMWCFQKGITLDKNSVKSFDCSHAKNLYSDSLAKAHLGPKICDKHIARNCWSGSTKCHEIPETSRWESSIWGISVPRKFRPGQIAWVDERHASKIFDQVLGKRDISMEQSQRHQLFVHSTNAALDMFGL